MKPMKQKPIDLLPSELDSTEHKNKVNDLISLASHDLLGPVRHISFATNFLKEELPNQLINKETNFMLESIASSADNLNHLVQKLRQYISLDFMSYNKVHIKLEELIFSALNFYENSEPTLKINMIKGQDIRVYCDIKTTLIALENIIANAIEYGCSKPQLEISAQNTKKHVLVQIFDNGPGIPEKLLNKALKPLSRLHNRDDCKMSPGLGLAISHKIFTKQNVDFTLKAPKSGGLLIEITLPKAKIKSI